MSRILLVDDDSDIRSVFRKKLELLSYEVEEADCAEAALGKLKAFHPDVVITDVRMDGITGLELLSRIKESMEDVDVIVMTGHDTMGSAVEAMKSGAFDYLVKPVGLDELGRVVERCLSEQEQVRASTVSEMPEVSDDDGSKIVVGRDPRMV